MESPIFFFLVIFLFTITKNTVFIDAQVDEFGLEQVMSEDFELPMRMSSLYEDTEDDDEIQLDGNGRSLLWHRMFKYYISYGALSANRIPCPPRSGRSYYTHHCYHATGPAHPYTRGCSAITRCRR
ncbi:protein RALF-like 34 [Solanum dulcamara]|uniref:protein RALF-like 34 n=1 Tax=Solanum dulcamara TaxID=45834 RepID=UPI0024861E6D|nr:protein RALF-like 34 [Solanum dulcamara]